MLVLLASLALQITPYDFAETAESQLDVMELSADVRAEAARRLSSNPRGILKSGRDYCNFRYRGGTDEQLNSAFSSVLVNEGVSQKEGEIRLAFTLSVRWAAQQELCPRFRY